MKKFNIIFIFLLIAFQIFPQSKNISTPEITSEEIKEHISYLASDSLKGRFTGSDEMFIAADYIKNAFENYNLKPLFNKSYFQDYKFISNIKLTKNNFVQFIFNKEKIPLKLNEDFVTAPFSGNNKIESNLVFVGYGISAPKLNYDDYNNIDVKNKIVIVLRNHPDIQNPHSEFENYSSLRLKASTAKDKGAIGMILINQFIEGVDEDKFIPFKYDRASGIKDFPVIQVKRNLCEKIFQEEAKNLIDYEKKINESKTANSFELKNAIAKISTEIEYIEKTGRNVAAYLEGNDPILKNEYLVIGAHFDHLGLGEFGSLYRGKDTLIHNGADDNSSGTSGVLELAQKFASIKNETKKSIIFVSFSGEELGLLGSSYFVSNLSEEITGFPITSEKIITMVNMDMIGRLNEENSLIIYGTGTSSKWKKLLEDKNTFNFKLTFNDEGYGPSDHSSFYGKNIPVLFFFTGTHTDYHRPTDDVDKINFIGEEKILNYIFSICKNIVNENEKPDFVKVPQKEDGTRGGWKVYVGTIPDYSFQGEGLKITGVNDGSPAQKSGLQDGDIILSFGDRKINNIYDYVNALQESLIGEVKIITYKRDDKILKTNLKLESR
ncbi:MAG: hypothetical protein STSR0008_13110 [Ignavibacterium sp.]